MTATALCVATAQAGAPAKCPWLKPGLGIGRRMGMLMRKLSLGDKINRATVIANAPDLLHTGQIEPRGQ